MLFFSQFKFHFFITIFSLFLLNENYKNSILFRNSYTNKQIKNSYTTSYKDFINKKSIKTVLLQHPDWEFSYPVIDLKRNNQVLLSFDELADNPISYTYTLIHCNSDWQQSRLMPHEYIAGFEENQITDYNSSVNTTIPYIHYELKIPNEDCQPIVSGNYAIIVYEDYNREKVAFVKRFYVVNHKTIVNATIKRATLPQKMKTSQEVDFSVFLSDLSVNDARSEIKSILMQNFRKDNAVNNLKPLIIKDKELVYDFHQENNFEGINEFRFFDIRNTRKESPTVFSIDFFDGAYDMALNADEERHRKPYFYEQDFNGQFVIEVANQNDPEISADYVFVHFTLPMEKPLLEGNVYIFGALSNWETNKENQMRYNYEARRYEAIMQLKQGVYNYQYAYVKNGTSNIDLSYIEGSHFETENNYMILIYYNGFGSRYDELVGYGIFNSLNEKQPNMY